MNSEEGVSLAKMAVSILLVVLVIGAVVGVVYAAYSWFNQGQSQLGDQVTSISSSSYSQYDDAKVSGVDVLSALKSYRESEMAILICNKNNKSGQATTGGYVDLDDNGSVSAMNYCAAIKDEATKSAATAGKLVTVKYSKASGQFTVPSIYYDESTHSVKMLTNFSPTTQSNKAEQYVKQSADWYANLVYSEETGDVCGILFRQMN